MAVLAHLLRLVALVAVLATAPLAAQTQPNLPAAEKRAIRTVIEGQMGAFRADDGERAFGFASPNIRGIFRTADNFMAMVRNGYQPVYRPREVRFGDLVTVEAALVQKVYVTGPDGRRVLALYVMERQGDGRWLINGCMLAEPEDEV
jgi:ketosteroid isomerase-like protein